MDKKNEDKGKEWIPREREESLCPCKSRMPYKACCMLYHYGRAKPETAEQLMRSRYAAYFFRLVDYLVETTHPDKRTPNMRDELAQNIDSVRWSFLKVGETSKGQKDDKVGKVAFVAEYYLKGELYEQDEKSRFRRHKGNWKYLDDKG